mmetsp:Transcript_13442/g.23109  ORF Transcript_13442/g.23109 Transcript_13442/m.23109 type:complete len:210 (-) Transcript_13442:611-1240(-)
MSASFLQTFFSRFPRNRFATSALSSGGVWLVGDLVSQKLSGPQDCSVDWRRALRNTAYGALISGPLCAAWYPKLDAVVSRMPALAGPTSVSSPLQLPKLKIIAAKLVADCFVFEPPCLALFFAATTLLRGESLEAAATKIQQDWPLTFKMDLQVWTPIQTVNFFFVPAAYQGLCVNAVSVFWNAYLSYVDTHGSSSSSSTPALPFLKLA